MPELPEVEAARRAIEENCLGKKIKRVIIADDNKVIDDISPSDFQTSILGKTIVSAHRKGKNLWLVLDSPPFPSFQFGMAGAVYIKGVAVTKYKGSSIKDSDEWPSKYSKFFVELDDGLEFSFTDKRRFAKVRLLENPASVRPISELGPDALLEPMTVDEFAESLAKKKMVIKALLLDQGFISGIGNWIADEVLYQARIHPLQTASSLSKEQCEALHTSIKEVIQHAVQVSDDSKEFPLDWLFHFRWGKKPGKVNGKKIDFITAGGRTSAYVPELQKLFGKDAEKAAKARPGKKSVKSKEDDEEEDEQESEKGDDSAKPKKGQKPRGGRGKKPASKKKTEDSEDDEDNDADDGDDSEAEEKVVKPKGSGTKPASKKKTEDSEDDEDNDADDGDDSEAEEKVVKPKGRGTKPAIKRKPETNATSQAGKKPKGRKS